MTELRHDPRFLNELRVCLDRCYEEMTKRVPTVEHTRWMMDLRDYFIFLTLDAIEDVALARKLVPEFKRLQDRTKTHPGFFLALSKLLSLGHPSISLPEMKRPRQDFMRSFEKTLKDLDIR